MSKQLTSYLLGIALAITTAGAAYAMEPSEDKKYTLDILSPLSETRTTGVGGRMFISSDTAVEASGHFLLAGKNNDQNLKGGTAIWARGGIMKYISKGRVSPYMRAGGSVGLYFGDRYENQDNALQGYAGIGAEFMITPELSIRASADGVLEISPFILGTQTSEISLSFFF